MITDTATRQTHVLIQNAGDPVWSMEGEWVTYAPVWTPDSRAFYYVRKDGKKLTLHRTTLAGTDSAVLLPSGNIVDLRSDGKLHAYVAIDAPSAQMTQDADSAKRDGMLLVLPDVSVTGQGSKINQFAPWKGPPDFSPKTVTSGYDVDLRDASVRPQPVSPGSVYVPDALTKTVDNFAYALFVAVSPKTSTTAFVAKVHSTGDPGELNAIYTVSPEAQRAIALTKISEIPIRQIDWAPDGDRLYYLRATNYTGENIFEADPKTRQSRQVTHGAEYLYACSYAAAAPVAACTLESTQEPREIALVHLGSGSVEKLTALNAGFERLDKTPIETIVWKNKERDRMWGVLTYPAGYRSGKRYPLVITLYRARKFLRGAVGDEYPVAVFAANGFMVLSVDIYNIDYVPLTGTGQVPFSRIILHWQSPLDGIKQMIATLDRRGLIDAHRVGITGLSEGSEIVDYAISHAHDFAAAISDGGSARDPMVYYLKSETEAALLKAWGLDGSPYGENAPKWKMLSPALNAGNITAPLLMNAPDSEYLDGLQQYWEMHDHKRPVEMWIFPDETHVKHQPVHRLMVYKRNLDWLRFWLQGYTDPDPAKAEQYVRWEQLRQLQRAK
jgi:dipeptidyl aminopeptidase/acylaminoacyl peptidase